MGTRKKGFGIGADERRRASRRIGEAYRFVGSLRPLFLSAAALVLVALLLVASFGTDATLLLAGLGATLALLVVGSWRAKREPLLWSVVSACFVSAYVVLLYGGGIRGAYIMMGCVLAAALWIVVPIVRRAQRLMREHPDLYITERWQGRREAADESRIGRRVRDRRDAARRRNLRLASIAAVVLAGLVAVLVPRNWADQPEPEQPPGPFEPYARRFLEAWNLSDLDGLEQLIHGRDMDYVAKVRARLHARGWTERLPQLGPPRYEEGGHKLRAVYPIEEFGGLHELKTVWWWADGHWWWYSTTWPAADDVRR